MTPYGRDAYNNILNLSRAEVVICQDAMNKYQYNREAYIRAIESAGVDRGEAQRFYSDVMMRLRQEESSAPNVRAAVIGLVTIALLVILFAVPVWFWFTYIAPRIVPFGV